MRTVEFWYEFASTYSYPAAMRIETLAKAAGVAIVWRPFLLGPIFASQGWTDSPFNLYPVKGAYMWRDLERICAKEGLKLTLPPFAFPQNGLKAARLAIACGARIADFSRAVYTANFAQGKDISDDDVLTDILRRLNILPQPIDKAKLKAQTKEAIARGIFGAPSFTAGSELFWGNDRLEDALTSCAASP
ncbi:MAG TPA: 2-hydroxychromene-2-carboxylate isomerase [Rhizomicrobium sp.]|jgi:2-hydroxychromene-2-carboxylate isomerase